MAKQFIQFEAQDGKKFGTEAEADGHDKLISIAKVVDAYIAAAGLEAAEATRAKKYIAGFDAFTDSYEGENAYSVEELAEQAVEAAAAAKAKAAAKAAAEPAAA